MLQTNNNDVLPTQLEHCLQEDIELMSPVVTEDVTCLVIMTQC